MNCTRPKRGCVRTPYGHRIVTVFVDVRPLVVNFNNDFASFGKKIKQRVLNVINLSYTANVRQIQILLLLSWREQR